MAAVLSELLRRRVPHVAGIYLAAGWGLLEFTDWAGTRFELRPDLATWVLAFGLLFLGPVLWLSWRLGGRITVPRTPHAPPRSVAVLPFQIVGGDPESAFLGFGLAEQILTDLARIGDLKVASRTSSFAFDGVRADVREIGRKLGVRAVLEGSVQRVADRLRVTTQLVSAEDGFHLWSERYDRGLEDLFSIEDDIAQSVARALKAVLRERERRALQKVPTHEIGALEAYLKGRQFYAERRRRSLGFAREMYEQAIQLDPGFARAWAGVAETIALTAMYYPSALVDLDAADRASRRALELDPELAEAHVARGAVLFIGGDLATAEAAFVRAEELDPRLFEARYLHGRACFQAGRFEDAARIFEEAFEIAEDYQAAFFAAQSRAALGGVEFAREAYERALDVAGRHMALNPDDPRAATMRAVALSRVGRVAEGLDWAERAIAIDPEDAGVRYNVACLYAVAGRQERALECLEQAADVGFGNRDWLERDPDLESVRGHPRFQALMARMSGGVPR